MNINSLTRRQPFSTIYVAYFLGKLLFHIPLWFIFYLPRANRPRTTWTISRCIYVRGLRYLVSLPSKIGNRAAAQPKEGTLFKNGKCVWVEGLAEDSELFSGEVGRIAAATGARPAKFPAYWHFRPGEALGVDGKANENERTVLHLHGGAFYVSPSLRAQYSL